MTHEIKGLYYCQYLVGIGHLMRSLNVCRSLVKTFEIDFLLGGHDIEISMIDSPHFHLLHLSPVGLSNAFEEPSIFEELYKNKLTERFEFIEKLTTPYSFLIIEMFPFGKQQFRKEIEALILKIKNLNPHCLVACSLRDSSPPQSLEFDQQSLDFINRFYDVVFVHSDPRVYKLEESFSLSEKIKSEVIYTGFIVRQKEILSNKKREKRIVVSLGSGTFGEELFYAILKVVGFFPNYQFVFVHGPKASNEVIQELHRLIDSSIKNVEVVPFINNFPQYLSESALSISLGGYTIMDVVYTKTPAIVYPSTFYDQYVRALKLSAFDCLKIITQEHLTPSSLKEVIEAALSMPPSEFDIDMSGVETTVRELERLLKIIKKQ